MWASTATPVSNYERQRSHGVLHREANNKLHNSDEKKFYEVASVKSIRRSLTLMVFLTNKVLNNFEQISC